MGISQDNWHKRRKTRGKRKPYHKKRKYELGRPAASPETGPSADHSRVQGGNEKYRVLRLDLGNFSWCSECCTLNKRIADVVCQAHNSKLICTETLVRSRTALSAQNLPW